MNYRTVGPMNLSSNILELRTEGEQPDIHVCRLEYILIQKLIFNAKCLHRVPKIVQKKIGENNKLSAGKLK